MTYTDNLLGRLFFNFSDISSKQQINSELLFKIKCSDKYDPIVLSTYAQILVMYRKVSKAFLHKIILTNKTYTATAYHYLTWLTESSLLMSISRSKHGSNPNDSWFLEQQYLPLLLIVSRECVMTFIAFSPLILTLSWPQWKRFTLTTILQ